MISFESNILASGAQLWGWVKFFNAEKGFGFVSVHLANDEYVDVFIRAKKGRKVTGTNADYRLTGDECDYSSYRFRRDDTQIVMVVEPSNRGWRARSWGVMPEYTWIDRYRNYPHVLEEYVGGRVELQNRSDYGAGGYTARIDGLELTREALTVKARHYPMWWESMSEPSDDKLGRAFEHAYPLAGVTQSERHGWLELSWRDEESSNMLRFFPPARH